MTKIKKISAIMVAAVILCTCFLMSGCGGDTESSSSEKATSAVSNEETTSASTDTTDYKSSYTAIIDVKDYGKIEVELYEELAPITVKNFVMFFILVLIYMFTGSNVHPNLCALLMPLILLSSALLGTGCGLIVSSVTTKYRDLGVLVSFGVTLWMYITPVVYPVSQVSDSFRPLALLNPVAPLIETFRYGFLGSGTFPWQYLILSFAVTAVVLLFGIIVFNRVEKNFIDTV